MFWNGLKISFLIVGTIIGAGFATGREIWEFFTSYGPNSRYGITVAMLLFAMSCYIIMRISRQLQSDNYVHVLEAIIGPRFARIYDVFIFVYLFSVTTVMFAGSGQTMSEWTLSYWIGVVFLAFAVFIVFLRNVEGIISLNSILIPILIMTLIGVSALSLRRDFGQELPIGGEMSVLPSAIIFTAFNILPLIAVLAVVGRRLTHGEIIVASVCSAVFLAAIGIVYNEALLKVARELIMYEIPLFAILQFLDERWFGFVSVVLWLAIFTTAISGMLGLVSRLQTILSWPRWVLALSIICLIIPLTQIGFSNLIQWLYPLYGVLNLFVLTMIFIYPLAHWRWFR